MIAKKPMLWMTLVAGAVTATVTGLALMRPANLSSPSDGRVEAPATETSPELPVSSEDGPEVAAGVNEGNVADAAAPPSHNSGEDPDLAFIRERLTAMHGALEADFLMRVAATARDWDALQATVTEHEALTGNDYRALLMKVGINARVIPADELARLLDAGVMPPPGVAEQLVTSSDSALVRVFAERGLVPDLNTPNRSSGRDALGTLVLNVAYAPSRYDERSVRDHVNTFVSLGARPDEALIDAFRTPNRSNVEQRIWLARALIDNGATLGPEHAALIRNIRLADVRRRFEEEFPEAAIP